MNHYSKNSLMNDSTRDTNISRNTYFFLKESRTLGNCNDRESRMDEAPLSPCFLFYVRKINRKVPAFEKRFLLRYSRIARDTRNGEDKSNADEFVTYLKKYLAHKSNTRSVDVAVVAR